MNRIPLFAANFKMNLLSAEVSEFVPRLLSLLGDVPLPLGQGYEVMVAPTALHLPALLATLTQKGISAGCQNSGPAQSGAFTGEIAPAMLKDLGIAWTLVGHSERRHVFGEDDNRVFSRLEAALAQGLKVILCVGETLAERRADHTFQVVERQLSILLRPELAGRDLSALTIAYEPVWAIGTGENATPAQAQEVHAFIRGWLSRKVSPDRGQATRILYGGSVKPENAETLLAEKDVDGLLVGSASLVPASFAGIIRNGLKSRARP